MSSGESRRRAEIEAKRAKLAELKRAREERTSRLAAGRAGAEGSRAASESTTPSSRRDLDEFVAALVGAPVPGGRSSRGGSRAELDGLPGSPRKSGALTARSGSSEIDISEDGIASGTGGAAGEARPPARAEMVTKGVGTDQTLEDGDKVVEVQPERVFYTKEVQTSGTSRPVSPSDFYDPSAPNGVDVPPAIEEAIRTKLLREQAEAKEREEIEASKQEEAKLEQEIAESLRQLTAEELGAIYGASDFTDFVEHSTKIVERALTDSYDFLKDYTTVGEHVDEDDEGRQVKCVRAFWDEKQFASRSVTALDWSTVHPELSVASYSRSAMAGTNDPDGLVAVWNIHLADRPEFVFQAQTDVLSVAFSPFQPNLVIGGTYSGQILLWDTRARSLPVLKTPLSASGHTHPVYSLQIVGTQNAHNLLTASTDGTVCTWMLDMLARPQETLELLNPNHVKTDEVSVTCVGFPDQETTTFLVGTEEGNVYSAARYDRAGAKAGLNASEVYRGHTAPVTGLAFHPLVGPVDFSDLFLTCSMDWTTRLWRARPQSSVTAAAQQASANTIPLASGGSGGAAPAVNAVSPLLVLEEATDQVFDVKWHTQHPAVFAQVDSAGRFHIFNLNIDSERPLLSTTVGSGHGLNKVAWDRRDGRRAAMGGADGRVYIYDIGATLAQPSDDDWLEMQKTVARLLSEAGASGGAANGATSEARGSSLGFDGVLDSAKFAGR